MSKFLRIHIPAIFIFFALSLSVVFSTFDKAHASWEDDNAIMRIGVLNTHPIAQNNQTLAEISKFYADKLGINVEVIRFNSLGSLMDAHGSARVHYAMHSARSFATMAKICNCLQAIARPLSAKGSGGFRSVLMVRDDMKDDLAVGQKLRIGFSQKGSMSGWIVPGQAAKNNEFIGGDFIELGSVKNVIAAFERQEIDGFFGWVPASTGDEKVSTAKLFDGFYNDRLQAMEPINVAWWSKIIHHGPHAVHNSLPDEFRVKLTELLLDMESQSPQIMELIEPYFSGGFEKAGVGDYNAISAALNLGSLNIPIVFDNKLRSSIE